MKVLTLYTNRVDITDAGSPQKDFTRGVIINRDRISIEDNMIVIITTQLLNRQQSMTQLRNKTHIGKMQGLSQGVVSYSSNMGYE